MKDRKQNNKSSCKKCGECCHMEIPLTLLDIQRIAELKDLDEEDMFRYSVQDKISERSSLFMIKKKQDNACVFLDDTNNCSIHTVKPNVCQFYNCSLNTADNLMPWTVSCTDPSQRVQLWEQSIASMVTKAYIRNNGPAWNRHDYDKAIKTINDNIVINKNQKIKLAREKQGEVLAMIYDCSICEKKGMCAEETPVTLDDIRRISAHLGISCKAFFNKNIMHEPSTGTGGLRLKRDSNCIFFLQDKHCTIEEVRPMHCRFRPCPMKTKTSEEMDALFLGSGTIDEQFRHQVALAFTREYVLKFGTRYNKNTIDSYLNKIDEISTDLSELENFCKKIAPFRYVDDTLTFRK